MNRTINFIFPAFAAVVLLASCGNDDKVATATQPATVNVVLATPSTDGTTSISASGQVEASQTAAISTRVMGTINTLTVKVGDRVSQGQVLATISDDDIKAKGAQTDAMIAEAEAHFAAAQKDYTRFTNLYKQESATAKELEMVTLQYNAAKAKVDAARQMKNEVNAMASYATLRAPFSGIVTQKLAEVGNIANPGMPILMIENSGVKQISASVAESDISKIKLGETATVLIKSTGKTFEGKVVQINPSSQFTGAQYIIKVSIPASEQQNAMPGMYVNLSLAPGVAATTSDNNTDEVLIPAVSIVYRDELTGVYTLGNENTALLRWVRLGRTHGDKVEVLSGLGKDESFILSADGKLTNGIKVNVKK